MSTLVLGKGFISEYLNFDTYENRVNILNIDFDDILKHKPTTIINCIGKTRKT